MSFGLHQLGSFTKDLLSFVSRPATHRTMIHCIVLVVSALSYLQAAAHQYVSLGETVRYYQSSKDLYYVMEKVTTAPQAKLWYEVLTLMDSGYRYKMHGENESLPYTRAFVDSLKASGMILNHAIDNKIMSGAEWAGPMTVHLALRTFSSNKPVELWISYAWSSTEPPAGPIKPEDLMKIEMAVTVTTRAPFLYTWHMGITRNALWKHAPGVIKHSRISIPMHSFAARVMSDEHPELYYVMSRPMKSMIKIFKKELAQHIGHTVFFNWDVIEDTEDGERRLYTLEESPNGKQLIWEGSADEFVWPCHKGSVGKKFLADIKTLANAVAIDE